MSAVDFEQWAVPGLTLTFRGRDYLVPPPDVEAAKMVLAAAALGEVRFGLVKAELPPEVLTVLESIGSGHPALSQPVYEQMVDDKVPQATIDRLSVYATYYWARGKDYADNLAIVLWTPRDVSSGGGARPKGSRRRRTGPLTESGNPTPKAGTRTTGRRRKS